MPKTIDNDIPIIDKSFGFETAVGEALAAIKSAYVEANAAELGVGLVRLMGRNAGFIAMEATNADVNICLIPEFKFDLYGENGVLEHITHLLKLNSTCVIVVAEGAGSAIRDADMDPAKKENVERDESGNVKLGDIGIFFRDKITEYCKN